MNPNEKYLYAADDFWKNRANLEYDYVLKAAVGGTAGYERLLREKIYRLPGVRHTRTAFTLRCLKRVLSPVP